MTWPVWVWTKSGVARFTAVAPIRAATLAASTWCGRR